MPQIKPITIFFSVFFASLLYRLWFVFQPALIWWDSAVYMGMGKYIYTNGQLGFFEIFRPLLWPIIQGGFWKAGIDPNVSGKIIAIFASLGILILVYTVGESMKRYAGTISASILIAVPIFMQFSIIPITDIPSAFSSLLAVWLALNKNWFKSGIAVGIAFSLRFPHALLVVPIILFIIIEAAREKAWRKMFSNSMRFAIGAGIFIIPFLIFAQIRYGNAISPILAGTKIVDTTNEISSFDYFYYIKEIFKQNSILLLGYMMILALPFYRRFKIHNGALLLSLCFIIVGGYFSQVAHKEVRYSMAFITYAVILSGYAIACILGKIPRKIEASALLIILAFAIFSSYEIFKTDSKLPESFYKITSFERFFQDKNGSRVVTNYPMIVAVSDVKIDEISDSWENALDAYSRRKNSSDYFMINSCNMSCVKDEKICTESKESLLSALREQEKEAYSDKLENGCQLLIYKIKE